MVRPAKLIPTGRPSKSILIPSAPVILEVRERAEDAVVVVDVVMLLSVGLALQRHGESGCLLVPIALEG